MLIQIEKGEMKLINYYFQKINYSTYFWKNDKHKSLSRLGYTFAIPLNIIFYNAINHFILKSLSF